MKKHYRILILLALLLVNILSGCWSKRELNEMSLVMGLAIDSCDNPDEISVVSQIAKPEILDLENNLSQEKSKPYWNVYSKGDNIGTALQDSTFLVSREIYIGQNQVLIFGQEIAMNGIMEHLNYFARSKEARLSQYIIVSRSRAYNILEVETQLERFPSLKLLNLIGDKTSTDIVPVRIIDFASAYISPTTAPTAPMVEIIKNDDEQDISVSGMAVFLGDKMVGELDKTETRGYMWVTDKIKRSVISIPSPDGMLNLDIIKSKTTSSAVENSDSGYTIKLKIEMECNLAYQKGNTNIILEENLVVFESNASEAIKAEIFTALDKARSLRADVFGFGEILHRKYPKQWDEIKGNWTDIFLDLDIQVEAKVMIKGIGSIINNIEPEN